MQRREFMLRLLAGVGSNALFERIGRAQGMDTASPLPWFNPSDAQAGSMQITMGYAIKRPGRYYLDSDLTEKPVPTFEGVKPDGRGGVLIESRDVEIDFRGHTVSSLFGQAGIGADAKYPRITIRNGTIDNARKIGLGSGSALTILNYWSRPEEKTGDWFGEQILRSGPVRQIYNGKDPLYPNAFPECERKDPDGDPIEIIRRPYPRIDYLRNDYLIEDMTIKTDMLAVAVEGSHTIIRNCVIESQGVAALFIAGPNVTIENCTIHLKKQCEGSTIIERPLVSGCPKLPREMANPPRAAIVLRDGSNAMIRNNRIRVDYADPKSDKCVPVLLGDLASEKQLVCPWDSPTSAILVQDGAKNVLVEGNTFINVRGDPVTLSEGAEAIVRDNKMEKTWL